MAKVAIFFVSIGLWSSALTAQQAAGTTLESQRQQQADVYSSRIQSFRQQQIERHNQFRKDYLKRYFAYQSELIGKWGSAEVTDTHSIVHYNEDQTQKIAVDYENNQIRVSVLVSSETSTQPDLQALAAEAATLKVADALHGDRVDPAESSDTRPLIETMSPGAAVDYAALAQHGTTTVAVPDFSAAAEKAAAVKATAELPKDEAPELAELAESSVARGYSSARATGAENSRVYSLTIQLPASATIARAKLYQPLFQSRSVEYAVDQALALAIAETESGFNPAARSLVPAYGLMQIVPKSAGLDVNRTLHQKDEPPSAASLYDAGTNIEFGTGYLHLLIDVSLRGVKDPRSRTYCAIAAYNTGPSNLARAFNGHGNKDMSAALPIINRMTPDAVYQTLQNQLPYEETRKYLQRVSIRLARWSSAIEGSKQ